MTIFPKLQTYMKRQRHSLWRVLVHRNWCLYTSRDRWEQIHRHNPKETASVGHLQCENFLDPVGAGAKFLD